VRKGTDETLALLSRPLSVSCYQFLYLRLKISLYLRLVGQQKKQSVSQSIVALGQQEQLQLMF